MKKRFLLLVLVVIVSAMGIIVAHAGSDDKDRPAGTAATRPWQLSAMALSPAGKTFKAPVPKWSTALAFDLSVPLRDLAKKPLPPGEVPDGDESDHDRGPLVSDRGFSGDPAVQASIPGTPLIPSPILTFEGVSNQDNFNIFGGRVNPPDPVGDVGPNHYVEMVNLVMNVYDKKGNSLLGAFPYLLLWDNFAVPDCAGLSGDPIVLYDQHVGRWILSQFTTAGPEYFNCVAVSKTGDPLGTYYRYAFSAGLFFPDYPKYGVWTNSYLLTSRDFGPTVEYGISVYALEKAQMISGNPKARAVQFFLDSDVVPLELIGDGLLPADWDGSWRPKDGAPAIIVGTQDDGAGYGATFDALNIYELKVLWNSKPVASLTFSAQLPVDSFDSIFPCAGGGGNSRDCLPQPTVSDPTRELDILSYRQRPTWRLAYRNFRTHESLVTNQSVEAAPGVAGVRWYEIRRINGVFSVYQQGTFAPSDGVHRWMGSVGMDKMGNMALGYSVTNATTVFPGIRYTGRLKGDALGQMTLGEEVIINGTGAQMTTNSRWGDYTSMNIDPKDDCTFWYVNEYYEVSGVIGVNTVPWQTRIGSFKIPGCK